MSSVEISTTSIEGMISEAISSHTHAASDITQDSTHRMVSDSQVTTWNGKQDALGFTPPTKSFAVAMAVALG